jgi:KDO2-lipid IV(A) lauroyltransferase
MLAKSLLALVAFFLRKLPLSLALSLGALLGALWWWFVPIRKKLVISQLTQAFPDRSPEEIRDIARKVGASLGMNLVEFLRLDPRKPASILRQIDKENFHLFEEAAAKRKGVLVLTAHFGNWDLLVCSQSLDGHPIHIVSKQIKPEGLNRFWMESREACGVRILPDRGVRGQLLAALKDGGIVGFVLDQHAPTRLAVRTRFFDREVATSRGFAELALDSGAPIVPAFLVRNKQGRHTLHILPPVEVPGGLEREQAIARISQDCTTIIEQMISAHPEQWLWLHRRWKLSEK